MGVLPCASKGADRNSKLASTCQESQEHLYPLSSNVPLGIQLEKSIKNVVKLNAQRSSQCCLLETTSASNS